ncbi:hypothetical protein J2W43_005578 [Pseudomonas brassicacearum]|uniref:Uncharacterized protein n=1 Tax=Pseudomonas brassicacearum TaxID=930166 RepID=A0AAW8MJH4_9PSED|nr:hypothetical protein [Pseudomonas brassicacearum]MDR6961564.1 hypothetical protein [Pseudomonas brassicacearum]
MDTAIHCAGICHAGAWFDDHVVGDNPFVVERTENADPAFDPTGVDQFSVRLDQTPAGEMSGVFPLALCDLQGQKIKGLSQYRMLGGVQLQDVFSTTTVDEPGESSFSADDDQVVFSSPFLAASTGDIGVVPFGVSSFGEGLELRLLFGSRENLDRLLSHRNLGTAKYQSHG